MTRYLTRQKYSECQLVALLNCLAFWGRDLPDEDEYERLVDLVVARHGSALAIDKAFDELKLRYEAYPYYPDLVRDFLDIEVPVCTGVWDLQRGFHTVTIVGYSGDVFRIPNWRDQEWITREELEGCLCDNSTTQFGRHHGTGGQKMIYAIKGEKPWIAHFAGAMSGATAG